MSRSLKLSAIFGGSIGVLTAVLGVSAPAHAISFSIFSDRTAWETAVGGSFSEENFNSYTSDTFFNDFTPLDVGDFILGGSGSQRIDAPPLSFPQIDVDGSSLIYGFANSTSSLTVTFDSPITAFGGTFAAVSNSRITQLVADSEVPINIPDTSLGFFGIVGDGSFSTLTFQDGDGSSDGFGIDNLVYASNSASVPFEFSPTLGLFAVGGIWGVSRLRKRMTASNITK